MQQMKIKNVWDRLPENQSKSRSNDVAKKEITVLVEIVEINL
jgi:hypothetical protein